MMAVAAAATTGVASQPHRLVRVTGVSMDPTFQSGEWLLATKEGGPVRVGEVVVADTPVGRVIKRVAFVGGDKIYQYVDPHGVRHDMPQLEPTARRRGASFRTLPEGTVYLMGDNLAQSIDSRDFGPVPAESIVLRVPGHEDSDVFARYPGGFHRNKSCPGHG
jgi:signal peptidase I